MLAVAGCAVVALATLAAFQLSGGPGTNNDNTAGNVAGTTPQPSQGGTVSIPAGSEGSALTISGATVWDSSPSQSSINAAPYAYSSASTTGWQTTTQYKSVSFAGSYSGRQRHRTDLQPRLGSHTVDQAKFRVFTAGATVEVLTGNAGAGASPSWTSPSGFSGSERHHGPEDRVEPERGQRHHGGVLPGLHSVRDGPVHHAALPGHRQRDGHPGRLPGQPDP